MFLCLPGCLLACFLARLNDALDSLTCFGFIFCLFPSSRVHTLSLSLSPRSLCYYSDISIFFVAPADFRVVIWISAALYTLIQHIVQYIRTLSRLTSASPPADFPSNIFSGVCSATVALQALLAIPPSLHPGPIIYPDRRPSYPHPILPFLSLSHTPFSTHSTDLV